MDKHLWLWICVSCFKTVTIHVVAIFIAAILIWFILTLLKSHGGG